MKLKDRWFGVPLHLNWFHDMRSWVNMNQVPSFCREWNASHDLTSKRLIGKKVKFHHWSKLLSSLACLELNTTLELGHSALEEKKSISPDMVWNYEAHCFLEKLYIFLLLELQNCFRFLFIYQEIDRKPCPYIWEQ